jgi:hypothetical protein
MLDEIGGEECFVKMFSGSFLGFFTGELRRKDLSVVYLHITFGTIK